MKIAHNNEPVHFLRDFESTNEWATIEAEFQKAKEQYAPIERARGISTEEIDELGATLSEIAHNIESLLDKIQTALDAGGMCSKCRKHPVSQEIEIPLGYALVCEHCPGDVADSSELLERSRDLA